MATYAKQASTPQHELWHMYIEQLELYFVLNGITKAK